MPAKEKTAPKPPMSDTALTLVALRFRALSEPMRLKLLNLLMRGEQTVGQLVEATGSSQANVSKHLAVLRESGMVAMRKEGLSTRCRIADPIVFDLCEMMCCHLREEMEAKARAFSSGI